MFKSYSFASCRYTKRLYCVWLDFLSFNPFVYSWKYLFVLGWHCVFVNSPIHRPLCYVFQLSSGHANFLSRQEAEGLRRNFQYRLAGKLYNPCKVVAKIQAFSLKVIIEERRQLSETITLSNVLLLNQRELKNLHFCGGGQRSETDLRKLGWDCKRGLCFIKKIWLQLRLFTFLSKLYIGINYVCSWKKWKHISLLHYLYTVFKKTVWCKKIVQLCIFGVQ